jgi:Na+-transporting methylmalonyl-CoA/oxaloacetate decarboxylase gamma subunit
MNEMYVLEGTSDDGSVESVEESVDSIADESIVESVESVTDESIEASVESVLGEVSNESSESTTSSAYMEVFPKSGFENLPKDATMVDRLAYGGKVALIGMSTVFLVLIIIWVLCALLGKIFGNAGKKEQGSSDDGSKNASGGNAVPQQPVAQAPVAKAPAVDYSMVAVVASAAIAAYRGEDTVNFSISSINLCGNGAVALAPEVVAQIAASIACLEGKDKVDFTISSIRII